MAENKQEFDWKTMTQEAKRKYLETAVNDCSFAVGKTPEETKVIKSYKAVLASVSPVFDRMFNGDFLESPKPEGIPITDVDANDWLTFLQYIIHGPHTFVMDSKSVILNMYWLAKKYEIGDIFGYVLSWTLDPFAYTDPGYILIKALAIAVDSQEESLLSSLETIINKKIATKPIWGSCIYDVDEDTFCKWLQCDHSDIEIFNYIDTYARVHRLKRSAGGNGPLERMLEFVDFSNMDAGTFREIPLFSDILTTNEKLKFWENQTQ